MSNKELEPGWLRGVRDEKKELSEKISEVSKFLGENNENTNLLYQQLKAMIDYLNILNLRIERYYYEKELKELDKKENENEKEEN